MRIVVEGRPWSWNEFWKQGHWRRRSEYKQMASALVRAAIPPEAELLLRPVKITFTVYQSKAGRQKLMDLDNICLKPYLDALVGWIVYDDTPDYVREIRIVAMRSDERPRVEIEIEEIE